VCQREGLLDEFGAWMLQLRLELMREDRGVPGNRSIARLRPVYKVR